jgi:RNA polymerase sigma-70 factor (ECF subfamily)
VDTLEAQEWVDMSISLEASFLYDNLVLDRENVNRTPNLAEASEAALVAGVRSGDVAAFEELVRRYRNEVYAMSMHFLHDREESWDVSQEVFVKAYQSLWRFRGDASFKTWLMRITANHCKDRIKKRRLSTVPFEDAIESDSPSPILKPDQQLEAAELGTAIDKAVAALPLKHRAAFVLREYEGLSYQEMAEVMHCNVGTVMSRLHHARRKLQNTLIRMGFVEGD